MQPLVVDTNVVLDLLVFSDPATEPLARGLADGSLRWLATEPMRAELARVLAYPKIVARLASHQRPAGEVLADFDAWVTLAEVAPKAPVTCKDPDDQKFIDLAVAHQGLLLSKDFEVLRMAKRLARLHARVLTACPLAGEPLMAPCQAA